MSTDLLSHEHPSVLLCCFYTFQNKFLIWSSYTYMYKEYIFVYLCISRINDIQKIVISKYTQNQKEMWNKSCQNRVKITRFIHDFSCIFSYANELYKSCFNESWKNQKTISSKSEHDFLQNQNMVSLMRKRFSSKSENDFLQNQKTIFFKINNTKVGHILHKSMTNSLDIQYMCWHTHYCKFKLLYYTAYWSS